MSSGVSFIAPPPPSSPNVSVSAKVIAAHHHHTSTVLLLRSSCCHCLLRGQPPAPANAAELAQWRAEAENRKLMSDTQMHWLIGNIKKAKQQWKVIGNQASLLKDDSQSSNSRLL
jgi:PhoD-like phosphatase